MGGSLTWCLYENESHQKGAIGKMDFMVLSFSLHRYSSLVLSVYLCSFPDTIRCKISFCFVVRNGAADLNKVSLVVTIFEFWFNTHFACFLFICPSSSQSSLTWNSESLNTCLLKRWKSKGRWACDWEEARGRGVSLSHLLCSVTPSLHIYSVSSIRLFFFFLPSLAPFSSPALSCVTFVPCYHFMSDTHAHILHNLPGSHILHSCIIPLFLSAFCLLAKYFGFWLLPFCIHPPYFYSLRQESASDWGGCFFFKRIIARLRLRDFGIFRSLHALLSLYTVSLSWDDCPVLQWRKCRPSDCSSI